MALPTRQALGTSVSSTGTVAPPWPAVHAAGQIGVVFAESANETIALTDAQGFVEGTDSPQGAGTVGGANGTKLAWFWALATSSSMAAPTLGAPGDHISARMVTVSGCNTAGVPYDVTAGDFVDSLTSNCTIPGDTTTGADRLILLAVANPTDSAAVQVSGNFHNPDLANLSEWTFTQHTDGNGGGFNIATGELAVAGTYSSTTCSMLTGMRQGRVSIALMPPSAAVASNAPLGRRFRIPQVPSGITGVVGQYLQLVVKQLNAEGYISLFSGANPNTSGFTGIPGNMLVNIGSASTWTRVWVMAGSVASQSTNSWQMLRTA